MLSNMDMTELVALRHSLHQSPELSGEEHETAARIMAFLQDTRPDQIISGLGGTGVAMVYQGARPGPTVMLRAELDGLPIQELSEKTYQSQVPGKAHLCGHDGHMAMLCAVGRLLGRKRPERGRAILLFQPAEETGRGALAVLQDPQFAELSPDIAFSLHNLPGFDLGHVALTEGPANCASRGLRIELTGKTAHASMPETGISPMRALADLMPALTSLGQGGELVPGYRLVTLTHAQMGEPTFGVAPGTATLLVTLRCLQDEDMDNLCTETEALVATVAKAEGLDLAISYHDVFHACRNAIEPVQILRRACEASDIPVHCDLGPMRWSEDFGLFGQTAQSAMFLLGSGKRHPQLHNPDYDFPDDLIPIGTSVFHNALRELLG